MRPVIAGVAAGMIASALILSGQATPVPASTAHVTVRMFNIDDYAQVFVNGSLVTSAGYLQDTGLIDVSTLMQQGSNSVRFTLRNDVLGYTYGFQVNLNGSSVFDAQCGVAGSTGCNNQDFTLGVVYDHTVNLGDVKTPPPPAPAVLLVSRVAGPRTGPQLRGNERDRRLPKGATESH